MLLNFCFEVTLRGKSSQFKFPFLRFSAEPVVRIVYHQGFLENKTYMKPIELRIPGCAALCPLTFFAGYADSQFKKYYDRADAKARACVDEVVL